MANPNQPAQLDEENKALDLPTLVQAIKQDVLRRMHAGQIPRDSASFSVLHDYCDANCLGGLCEDPIFDALTAKHGGSDKGEGMPQGMLDLINAAQTEVDNWLRDRWPAESAINEDAPFSQVPDMIGAAWFNLAQVENQLAKMLRPYPKGTAVVLDSNAWFLKESGNQLILCIGDLEENVVTDPKSRHDFSLDFVDIEQESLEGATEKVTAAMEAFELTPITEME